MQLIYLLLTFYAPTLGSRYYALDIVYVNSQYFPATKVQQCEGTSVFSLDQCFVNELKT
jgi:hypothetical protein